MTFLGELKLFIACIAHWVYAFVGVSFFFFFFGLHTVTAYGREFILPIVSEDSLTVQFFAMLKRDLVPSGVELIVTHPLSGFITQVEIAMALAFIVTLPFLLFTVMRYLSPALFVHEQKAIYKLLLLATGLFVSGCVFAYFYLIPVTFAFMYPFTVSLGITPFFALDVFMAWVIGITLATGTMFLLPVFMILLSYIGIVPPMFWKEKWLHAFVLLLIFSAVMTPDQSGVTMMLLTIPLTVLYTAGSFAARKFSSS